MILELFLYSYWITTSISIIVMPIRTYLMGKKSHGQRKSIFVAFQVAGLCLIPYLAFCAMIYVAFLTIRDKIGNWMDSDPTSPKNLADPDFVPPPKKEKKFKPIDNRFDIMDL